MKGKDNLHNRKLKDLLDKNKHPEGSSMDDFDKEALDGFSMLENAEEALELKNKLDGRIYNEVFTGEKKSRRAYWYAAAGLAIIIGFSVYFLQNSPLTKHESLAVNEQKINAADEIQKDRNAQIQSSSANQEPEFKPAGQPNEKPKTAERKSGDNFKTTADKKEQALIPAAKTDMISAAAYAKEGAPSQAAAIPDAMEMQASTKAADAVNEEAERDAGSTPAKALSPAPASTNKDALVTPEAGKKKTPTKEKQRHDSRFSAEGASAGPRVPTASYAGGEKALKKDLENKLGPKNLLQKFDATLYIEENRKVEKVLFTSAFALSQEQQKEIIEILKQLDGFQIAGAAAGLVEYKLAFRP